MYKHTQQDYKSPTLDLLEIRLAETICTSNRGEIQDWDEGGTDFPVDF